MTQHNHQTVPTQFVEANGVRFAYRRFGKAAGVPLVFNQHFTGTMDHWDPAVTDGFAKDREVILFNNAGVSSSSGEVPSTIEKMGDNAVAFIKALRLSKVDVLGFSIGGFVAQEIAVRAPDLVRRLVLVGTARAVARAWPRSRRRRRKSSAPSMTSPIISGFACISRSQSRARPRAASSSRASGDAPRTAIPRSTRKSHPPRLRRSANGAPRDKPFEHLKSIRQPTLVVNGGKDVIIYAVNSFILQQHLPNAQLVLYPDANHGSQYQYPKLFVRHVSLFLSEEEAR